MPTTQQWDDDDGNDTNIVDVQVITEPEKEPETAPETSSDGSSESDSSVDVDVEADGMTIRSQQCSKSTQELWQNATRATFAWRHRSK